MQKSQFIQPHFKIQAQPKKRNDGSYSAGVCVGYIDARDCQEYLDKTYLPQNRQNKYYEVKDKTFCSIGIKCDGERVRKSDSGALSDSTNVDKDVTSKGDSSDAFKRACVMRGIGRYLYSLPTLWITQDEYAKNKYKINEFIRSKYKNELKEWYEGLFEDDANDGNKPKENHEPIPPKERVKFEDKQYSNFVKEHKKHLQKYTTAKSMIEMLNVQYILDDEYKSKITEFYKTIV